MKDKYKTVLVTGGLGFIGRNLIIRLLTEGCKVINIDIARNARFDTNIFEDDNYIWLEENITRCGPFNHVFEKYKPDCVFHLAADSHVDKSINNPMLFTETNVLGTSALLFEANEYLKKHITPHFKMIYVSTDEVYGSAENHNGIPATENTMCNPNSPYAASKAGGDMVARAYHRTYGFPIITTRCSNNYGPYQYPEKFIPRMIYLLSTGKPAELYGSGEQKRDWIHVSDHIQAMFDLLEQGKIGETYNVATEKSVDNRTMVRIIWRMLIDICNRNPPPYGIQVPIENYIKSIQDRPAHDQEYLINAEKIREETGWKPKTELVEGLYHTVQWYVRNWKWIEKCITEINERR